MTSAEKTPKPLPPSHPGHAHVATREALLDAAERLFSEHGVEGTSVRDIVQAASANLGAVNYHFGSKDRLVMEVFVRRLGPLNRERIARLDALEKAAGGRALKLEQIVEALVRPAVEDPEAHIGHATACMGLMSRCFQEPNPELKAFVAEQFAEVCSRFDAAILRASPALPPGELFWRISFLFGALQHGMQMWMRFENMPRPKGAVTPQPLDREGFIRRVVSFVSAGFAAEAPKP